jgi:hypothetical protein
MHGQKDVDSRDLLSSSPLHSNARVGEATTVAQQQEEGKKPYFNQITFGAGR